MFYFFSLPSTLTKPTLNSILIENTININSFFISSKHIYYNEKLFNEKMLKRDYRIPNKHYNIPGNN